MTSGRAPVNRRGLTQKQERFCLEYFKVGNATQAALTAGYSPKTAHSIATQNLQKVAVVDRLTALRAKAESASIMSVVERKQRLTEIARARMVDFTEADENGAHIKADLETVNSAALQEITTETVGGSVEKPLIVITKLKLHEPVKAIAELNKMDGSYAPAKVEHSGMVTVINTTVQEIVALFERVNLLPDPQQRRLEFARGADKIVTGQASILPEGAGGR